MPAIRGFGRQLKSLIWRDSIADQVDAELDFHIEMLAGELGARGMAPDAARAEALRRFGNLSALNAACRHIARGTERAERRTEYLAELRQDAVHALRQLRRAPGFTAAAVLTLVLAIGANTAIFSVVSAVLLRPLPYPAADRLTVLWAASGDQNQMLVSIPDAREWRARNRTFDDMGIVRNQSINLSGIERPDRLMGSFVDANALRLLGARVSLGRLFAPEETAEGTGRRVAIISDALWKGRFGGAAGILGRTLVLNGLPHVVIGVTAPDYQDPFGSTEVWVPISSAPNQSWFTRDNASVWLVGLLRPGVIREQAQRDLASIARDLGTEYPTTNAGVGVTVLSLQDYLVGTVRPGLLMVLGFVTLVLLIACANIANLQLARATSRRREMSLRAALGAGQGRLVRQLLTESLVLSALGGGLGIVAARWAVPALVAAVPGGLPAFGRIGLDGPVLLFSAAVTIASGLLFGAMPAIYAARADLNDSLQSRTSDGRPGGSGLRHAFVTLQLVLCIVLLVGAGLLTRSLATLLRENPGFDPHDLLTAEFRLPAAKYRSDAQITRFMADALDRIRAVPGVRSAALVNSVPLSGNWATTTYQLDGQPPAPAGELPTAQWNAVTDGYFETMRMPLLRGRAFTSADREGALPVAIVNQELARRAWPARSPLGQRLRIVGAPEVWVTVVGVVGNAKQFTMTEPVAPQVYQPKAQAPGIFSSVVARTDGDPMALAGPLREAIWSLDRDQPVWKIRSLESLLERDVAPPRFTTKLAGSFAALALVLAVVGVYGVMSYAVGQRTREIGIRMALGARGAEVVRMVVMRGLRVIGIATVLGLAVSSLAARLIRSLLYGVSATDLPTFAIVPAVLAVVAALACYVPARKAARVDPVAALRSE
jgi:putative ABC transport system permease protein